MTEETRESTSVLGQAVDEIRVQAWLAAAEFRNPSMHEKETREEVDFLAQLRDKLRVQIHLGKLDATDEWHKAENAWRRLVGKAAHGVHEVEEGLHDLLRDIRDGYQRIEASDT